MKTFTLPLLVFGLTLSAGTAQTFSSIGSTFNGTDIADSSYVWFNSHLTSVSGSTGPVTVYFRNQSVAFTSPATNKTYTLSIPDAEVRIQPSTGSPTTTFTGNHWVTTSQDGSSNPFLSGYVWDVPDWENPKASNPVTWSGDFYASQAGVSIQWQWSAAVYGNLPGDYTQLGVTPVDGMGSSQSGTPLNYTSQLIGGARGGGGSNFTGSNSATGSATMVAVIPEPASSALVQLALIGFALRRKR